MTTPKKHNVNLFGATFKSSTKALMTEPTKLKKVTVKKPSKHKNG